VKITKTNNPFQPLFFDHSSFPGAICSAGALKIVVNIAANHAIIVSKYAGSTHKASK
jgi:hypothetical protein